MLAALVVMAGIDGLRRSALADPLVGSVLLETGSGQIATSQIGRHTHASEAPHCGLTGIGRAAKRACPVRPARPAVGLAAAIQAFGSARATDLACASATAVPPLTGNFIAAALSGLPATIVEAELRSEACIKHVQEVLLGGEGDDDRPELTADDDWPDLVLQNLALAPALLPASERVVHPSPAAADPAIAFALVAALDRPPNAPAFARA